MSNQEPPPLEACNKTELLQILAKPSNGGHRLRETVPKERLIQIIRSGEQPHPSEEAQTAKTRKELEYWIREVAWGGINSQLPCSGENRGRCRSVYPCSEGRHLACYLAARGHL